MPHSLRKFAVITSLLVTIAVAIGFACSESNFSGRSENAEKEKKNPSGGSNGDAESGGTSDQADKEGKQDETKKAIDEFLSSTKKVSINENGTILQKFAVQDSMDELDVVFIIDMSSSMDKEIKLVEANLDQFLGKLETAPKSRNIQLFVLAGKNDNSFTAPAGLTNNPKFTYETANHSIDSYNLLGVARGFLQGSLTTPKIGLRTKAKKHLIIISDDEAGRQTGNGIPKAVSEAELRNYLGSSGQKDNVIFHAIICKDTGPGCIAPGNSYQNLARDSGGIVLEFTASDWTPLFDDLMSAITAKTNYKFRLKQTPESADTIRVYLEKNKLSSDKYSLDGDFLTIDSSIEISGKTVVIMYKVKQ